MSLASTWAKPAPRGVGEQDKIDAVWAHLTDAGRRAFRTEMETAEDQGAVVVAWHLSMRFATHPDRDAALERAMRRHRERVRPASFADAAAELEAL